MANLTNIIGGQPYYDATAANSESLLSFWKGTQIQYDAIGTKDPQTLYLITAQMPINLFNNPLSSIKLGADDILKGYIGNGQIFPNDTEITAAAFTDTYIANTGGNTPYVVSGETGASFTLTGSAGATAPSGTQVISSSPTTYQIAIGDQSETCDAIQRNSQVVITPQGNTVLASGVSNTDTIIQYAGPVTQTNNIGLTISVSNTSYAVQNIGGVLYWVGGNGGVGAEWIVTVNYTRGPMLPPPNNGLSPIYTLSINAIGDQGSAVNGPLFDAVQVITPADPTGAPGQAYTNSTTRGEAGSGIYSVKYRMQGSGSGQSRWVNFSVVANVWDPVYGFGCWQAVPSTVGSGNLFP